MAVVTTEVRRWKGGVIPYVIDPDFPYWQLVENAIQIWLKGFETLHINAPISFVRNDNGNANKYVKFVTTGDIRSQSCFAMGRNLFPAVGCVGNAIQFVGEQLIALNRNADLRVVCHEIGHAIGMFHEHTRLNRDYFVTVLNGNIKPGCEAEFDYVSPSDARDASLYDYNSIMHYRATEFSKDGSITISPRFPSLAGNMGMLADVSTEDVEAVNFLYLNA